MVVVPEEEGLDVLGLVVGALPLVPEDVCSVVVPSLVEEGSVVPSAVVMRPSVIPVPAEPLPPLPPGRVDDWPAGPAGRWFR